MAKTKSQRQWFYLPPEMEEEVDLVCDKTGMQKGEVFRTAIFAFLKVEVPPILEKELQKTALKMAERAELPTG